MLTLTTIATVQPDHTLTIRVPPSIAPGRYEVVVVIEEEPMPAKPPFDFSKLAMIDVGPWPENLSLRREDMYGDDGR